MTTIIIPSQTREPEHAHRQQANAPIYIGCSLEDLVAIELEGMDQGRAHARADGTRRLHGMRAISEAAHHACDRVLAEKYVPLDEARFREVFTLAWYAGYQAELEVRTFNK